MKFTDKEEMDWILTHFDQLMMRDSEQERYDYILDHPILLSMNVLKILSDVRGSDPEARIQLDTLNNMRVYFWNQPENYPTGGGPIEKVLNPLRGGVFELEEATTRIRGIDCAGLLSPVYVRALMKSWVPLLDLDHDFTMQAAGLVYEAGSAIPCKNLELEVRMQISEGYINLAHGSLLKRPNGTVFDTAVAVGRWACEVAKAYKNEPLRCEFQHEIGTMVLDAYASKFGPNVDYKDNIDVWISRASEPMPPPDAGLNLARESLQNAFNGRDQGSPRGLTAKALLETLVYQAFYTDRMPDVEYLTELSLTAKANLDQYHDVNHIHRVDELMGIYI